MADAVSLAHGRNALIPDLAPHFQQLTIRIGAALLTDLRSGEAATLRFARSAEERRHAQRILAQLLAVPNAWSLTRDLLLSLAAPVTEAGHRREWIPVLAQGLAQSKVNGDTAVAIELSFQLGLLCQQASDYQTSDSYLHESRAYAAMIDDRLCQARALNTLAFGARLRRTVDVAHQFVDAAMQIASDDARQLGWSHMVLGCLAGDFGEWRKALAHWQRSLNLYASINDTTKVALRLRDLGVAHLALKEHAQAIQCYEQAIATFQAQAESWQAAISQMNLGNVYLDIEKPKEALSMYWQAEAVFRQLNDKRYLALVYNNAGVAYDTLKDWPNAEQVYLSSIERWWQLDDPISLANALDGLGMVYLHQKEYNHAIPLFEQALTHLAGNMQPAAVQKAEEVDLHLKEARARLQHLHTKLG